MSRLATAHTLTSSAAYYSCSIRPVFCPTQEAANGEAGLQAQLQQLAEEVESSTQEAESKQAVVTGLQEELAAAHGSNEALAARLRVCAM